MPKQKRQCSRKSRESGPDSELHDQLAITVFNTDSHRRRVHDSNYILDAKRSSADSIAVWPALMFKGHDEISERIITCSMNKFAGRTVKGQSFVINRQPGCDLVGKEGHHNEHGYSDNQK